MSKEKKKLLRVAIGIIIISYLIVFYLIISNSDESKTTNKVKIPMQTEKQYSDMVKPSKRTETEDKPQIRSKYKGNQLPNGSSPFDACFGKGIYRGNATLTIDNGANSDAIVCLYSISKEKTIRNEYVQKNTSFTMDNIAKGNYKIRVFYGNDWNPKKKNPCGIEGFFESDVSFSEFDRIEYFEDSYEGYTVATVTLYTVAYGNASTSRISQSDFFNSH